MKKMRLLLAALAVVSLIAVSCQSGPDAKADGAKPAKPAKAKPVGNTADVFKGTPEVDAEMDDLYAEAQVLKTEAATEGETDVFAEARLLWDEEYLYVYIEVTDPVLSDKNKNEWEQDSVEVVIDQNNGKTGSYQSDDAQYRINFNNKVSFGTNGNSKLFKSAARVTDTGYVVEVAVPLNKVPGAAGNEVGFDVQVNEDDGSGRRTAIRCWNDVTNTNYMSTKNFGTIYLK